MLTAAQFAERFSLARATVDNRHRDGKHLAVRMGDKNHVRYPAWQGKLVSNKTSRRTFEKVLSTLDPSNAWSAYQFFTLPSPLMGGQTPIEAWRERAGDELVGAAEAWVADHKPHGASMQPGVFMSLMKQIHSTEKFACRKAKATVRFTVTRISTAGASPGPDRQLAYKPGCSGWSPCGAFPRGFPQEIGAVSLGTPTGCPWFDDRS